MRSILLVAVGLLACSHKDREAYCKAARAHCEEACGSAFCVPNEVCEQRLSHCNDDNLEMLQSQLDCTVSACDDLEGQDHDDCVQGTCFGASDCDTDFADMSAECYGALD